MVHDRKKPGASPFPRQQPNKINSEPSKIPAADIEETLQAALLADNYPRVLEVIDAAPRWMQRQPEFLLIRASVLLSLGETSEALRLLHEIERKNPRFMAVYLPLATFYMDRDWPAHALQAAQRALSDRELPEESRASLEQVVEEATAAIRQHATGFGLSFESMQHAYIFHERAQLAMDEGQLSDVENFAREAIKIAPNWNPPYNNRAQALYYLGKTAEAIAVSEGVLARDAGNVFAMSHLVTYYLGVNQAEKAGEYAKRLGQLSKDLPGESDELEYVITALALVEDTPALWKIAKRFHDAPPDILYDRSWLILAVAAVRSGKWGDALELAEKIGGEDATPAGKSLLEALRTAVDQRHPRLAWMPPAYPGGDLFFHPKVMAEWEALTQNFSDPLTPSQKRKLGNFYQKYPFMIVAMKRLLWDEAGHPLALKFLAEIETPDADAELLRFALSDSGNRQARMQALMALIQSERYTGPKVVRIWDEDLGDWRDVELNTQRVGPIEVNAKPQTMAMIEQARKTKDRQAAISLLRKAVELEPTNPIAIFNLGVILAQNGMEEEGEALIYHSVEVDPNYTYGHASIALTEANAGHEQEALDHLGIVTRADVIAPETAVMASFAWTILAIDKHDLKSARERLDLVVKLAPQHPLLENYEKIVAEAEDFEKKFGFMLDFQRESAQRAHRKMLAIPLAAETGLRACLETSSKEMLVATAHYWRISPSGKKSDLASRLVENLLDPEFLRPTLDEDLDEKERTALLWLLETDGIRPWMEFVGRYGDDMDESTVWDYQEPESIPGRLRRSGLFYSGSLEGQEVAFIPADARPVLRELLK